MTTITYITKTYADFTPQLTANERRKVADHETDSDYHVRVDTGSGNGRLIVYVTAAEAADIANAWAKLAAELASIDAAQAAHDAALFTTDNF